MEHSSPVRVPPSQAGSGADIVAAAAGTLLLATTAAIVLGVPQAHGLPTGTALVIVAISVAWGVAQAPLTVLWSRGRRTNVRIQRRIASYEPDVDRHRREGNRMRAEAGVARWELELGVIFLGVLVAIIAAFQLPGGPGTWVGDWTGATPALPALWALSSALRLLLMGRITGSPPDVMPIVFLVVLLGFPLMLFVPSPALLFLTSNGAVRFVVMGIEAGRSREDPVRAMHAALTQLGPDDARQRAAVLEEFVATAHAGSVNRESDAVVEESVRVAAQRPGRALRLAARLPQPVQDKAVAAAIRSWACEKSAADFDGAWAALTKLYTGPATRHKRLLTALSRIGPDQMTARFRREAALRVFRAVDTDPKVHPHPHASAWKLLETLAADGLPTTPGEWWCALAESAEDRGETGEAVRRYEEAVEHGCEPAKPRLAHLAACAGHESLIRGDFVSAAVDLTAAVRLDDSLDYRLLLRLAEEANGAGPDRSTRPAAIADALEAPPGTARTAAILLQLLRGDTAGGAELMRGAKGRADSAGSKSAVWNGLIPAVLTGDALRLAAEARRLVDRHGRDWAHRIPFDPATVLSRVAGDPAVLSADPLLPANLLKGLDTDDGKLAEVRAATAHRLLTDSARAADEHRYADAAERLNEAAPLLSRAQRRGTEHEERPGEPARPKQQTQKQTQKPETQRKKRQRKKRSKGGR